MIGVMLLTIQLMAFYLRTAFGDSTDYFGHSESPLQGLCQGNKGAPAMWLCMSAALVEMMHREGCVTNFKSAMSVAILIFIGFIFVDDTDLMVMTKNDNEMPSQIITCMQHHVVVWQGGLRASGGALKLEKCLWGLAAYCWTADGQWQYYEHPGELRVNDPEGNLTTTARYNHTTTIRIVAVHQAINGNMKQQLQVLQDKADEWCTKIKEGWVPQKLAHQGLKTMLWASLKYPLAATTLSDSEGAELTDKLFTLILPKLGAVCSYPKEFCHAPYGFHGLAYLQGKVEQEIKHITKVITHGTCNIPMGFLLWVSLEQAQLEVGTSCSFLNEPFDIYGILLMECFWKTIWQFIWQHGIRLEWNDQVIPKPQ